MFGVETLNLRIVPATAFPIPYDDPDGGSGDDESTDDDGAGNEDDGNETPPPAPKSKIKLDADTQKYVNSLLAKERQKGAQKNQQLITQLETEKNRAGTSAAEKASLEERIETLRSEYATKEELGKKATDKKVRELQDKVKKAEDAAAKWQTLFQSDRVTNSLLRAATEEKAYNPSQIVALLTPNTRLVEVLDEAGQPVPDSWSEKVKINGKDKDGKPIVLDLSATEAVKQLKEMPEFGNLFISGANGGLGGANLASRNGNSDDPPKDTAAYMAWRSERKKKGLPV